MFGSGRWNGASIPNSVSPALTRASNFVFTALTLRFFIYISDSSWQLQAITSTEASELHIPSADSLRPVLSWTFLESGTHRGLSCKIYDQRHGISGQVGGPRDVTYMYQARTADCNGPEFAAILLDYVSQGTARGRTGSQHSVSFGT